MKLVIFDIDGTIVDSVKEDDKCFVQTFQELHQIDLSPYDWSDFINVTDSGLTMEIFQKTFNRLPTENEVSNIKSHFYKLLSENINSFKEIKGAISFLNELEENKEITVAFATGGWEETAFLKAKSIGLDLNKFVLKTSNNHFERRKIIELAIEESLITNKINKFETITYIGDGVWDFVTSQKLNINFIGIDYHNTNRLKEMGVKKIYKDFSDSKSIIEAFSFQSKSVEYFKSQ